MEYHTTRLASIAAGDTPEGELIRPPTLFHPYRFLSSLSAVRERVVLFKFLSFNDKNPISRPQEKAGPQASPSRGPKSRIGFLWRATPSQELAFFQKRARPT